MGLGVKKSAFFLGEICNFAGGMTKKTQDIAYFLSFCIEQYKKEKNLTGAEAANILGQYGVLDYLEAHYEPIHSQSRQWIMEDIDEFIRIRKEQPT